MTEATLVSYAGKLTREQLALVPTPLATATHKPVPHIDVVQAIIETLGFRHIGVVRDEYAVSRDGMRMFGIMELETQFHGCRFALGLRNSHDRSMRLGVICGYRVAVCENMMFSGDFQPVLAKHSKNFSLVNALSIGIDQMQRNVEPMKRQIETWRESQLTDVEARIIIYEAFIEGELCVPQYLGRTVHDRYFNPAQEEFAPRTLWSLSNAFTSAFQQLDPVPQFKATARLGEFLQKISQIGR